MEAASGDFIYAETVLRFIGEPDWLILDEPLQAVLTVIVGVNTKKSSYFGSTSLSPFAQLDALYLFLLRRVPQEKTTSVWLLLTYLCLPLHLEGAVIMANLLRLSRAEIHAVCVQMSTVLKLDAEGNSFEGYLNRDWDENSAFYSNWSPTGYGETTNDMITGCEFYDDSFKKFLIDPVRSCEFCVTSSRAYESLFKNNQRLRFDYEKTYNVQDSGLLSFFFAPGLALS